MRLSLRLFGEEVLGFELGASSPAPHSDVTYSDVSSIVVASPVEEEPEYEEDDDRLRIGFQQRGRKRA